MTHHHALSLISQKMSYWPMLWYTGLQTLSPHPWDSIRRLLDCFFKGKCFCNFFWNQEKKDLRLNFIASLKQPALADDLIYRSFLNTLVLYWCNFYFKPQRNMFFILSLYKESIRSGLPFMRYGHALLTENFLSRFIAPLKQPTWADGLLLQIFSEYTRF